MTRSVKVHFNTPGLIGTLNDNGDVHMNVPVVYGLLNFVIG